MLPPQESDSINTGRNDTWHGSSKYGEWMRPKSQRYRGNWAPFL